MCTTVVIPTTRGPFVFLLSSFSLLAGLHIPFEVLAWFAACGGGIAWWLIARLLWRNDIDLVGAVMLMLVTLLLFSPRFLVPWYYLWLYPCVPLVIPPSRAPSAFLWLSLAGALSLIVPVFASILFVGITGAIIAFWKKRLPFPFGVFRPLV
jgi:hypothetical protein